MCQKRPMHVSKETYSCYQQHTLIPSTTYTLSCLCSCILIKNMHSWRTYMCVCTSWIYIQEAHVYASRTCIHSDHTCLHVHHAYVYKKLMYNHQHHALIKNKHVCMYLMNIYTRSSCILLKNMPSFRTYMCVCNSWIYIQEAHVYSSYGPYDAYMHSLKTYTKDE